MLASLEQIYNNYVLTKNACLDVGDKQWMTKKKKKIFGRHLKNGEGMDSESLSASLVGWMKFTMKHCILVTPMNHC